MPRELVEMQVYTPTSEAWKSRIWSCILVLYSLVFSSITVYLSLNTAMITSEGGGSWGGYDDDGDGGSISFYHQLVKLVSGVQ